MLDKILPREVSNVLNTRLDINRVYELRFRSDMPIAINYGGKYYYLGKNGLVEDAGAALVASAAAVGDIVVRATDYSLYSVNNQLIKGYITIGGGIRLGICGEIVRDGSVVKTIKNFSSVNIRIPHEVNGCALTAYTYINDTALRSSLIVAPPGAGKTTVLRDLTKTISREGIKNILLVDERSEIAAVYDGIPQLDVGYSTDIICNCSKAYAFSYGLRSMRPDVIVTDELMSPEDFGAVENAVAGGVTVIASVHASTPEELFGKFGFKQLFDKKIFSRYVFLSERNGPGTYENIFDGDMKCIYFGQ